MGYELRISKIKKPIADLLIFKKGEYSISYPPGHQLINYLNEFPEYSQNIGRIAKIIKAKYNDLCVIDIGANIGDTVIFIKNETNCPILAIEGDNLYFNYLVSNTQDIEGVTLCNAFLGEFDVSEKVVIKKLQGTAKISNEVLGEHIDFFKLDTILQKNKAFNHAKLLKIDTDGYDIKILNGSSEFIKRANPIIFLEYDINFYSSVDILLEFLKSLARLGYSQIVAYDNFGNYFLKIAINDYSLLTQLTQYIKNSITIYYYDFCIFHEEDFDLSCQLIELEIGNKISSDSK